MRVEMSKDEWVSKVTSTFKDCRVCDTGTHLLAYVDFKCVGGYSIIAGMGHIKDIEQVK